MFQLAPKEAGGSLRSHPRGRAGLWAPSELVRNANISTAAEIVAADEARSEEHTSELQSLMRISYAVFCLKKKKQPNKQRPTLNQHTRDQHLTPLTHLKHTTTNKSQLNKQHTTTH